MDLKAYIDPLKKWWWLLLVAALVAAISSFLVTRQQPPVYQASTALVIGQSVYDLNPTSNDLWLGQQLASYYADIAQRDQVRNATMETLGLEWLPEYSARPLPNSQIIEIVVRDSSPVRAQAVTNELANQLVMQAPSSTQEQDQERQDFVNQQLTHLEEKIIETQDEIANNQEQLADMNSARQIAESQQEIAALESKLAALQTNYATLLASSGQDADNTLSVIEQASLPTTPVGPNIGMIILLSTAIGFILASGAAYLLEYLDNTLKSSEEITQALQVPIIGMIPDTGRGKYDKVYVVDKPRSPVAESFRTLRTNLEFADVDQPQKTLLVTSAGINVGKTFVSINLASIIAQTGKSVILLDADLRKPSIHSYLGISNSKGLSEVFRSSFDVKLDLNSAFANWEKSDVNVITGGSPPPNPSELLGSKKMDQIIENLRSMADVIIIDGPPLIVADAIILSKKVDGVLVVVRHGYSNEGMAKAAMEQLKRAEASILGIVYNQIPTSVGGYAGMYQYYNKYELSENDKDSILPETMNRKQRFQRWFKKSDKAADKISPFDDIFNE